MKFAYEDLSDKQFEDLVCALCRRLLGSGVQSFSEGPDGGRDAKFNGKARLIPSDVDPWQGKIIVQAKHTNGYNKKFSDSDFFSKDSKTNAIGEEINRISNLVLNKDLDYYILFANRNMGALINETICEHIEEKTGLPAGNILLCGHEMIEAWLKDFPEVATAENLAPIDSPLKVGPEDLADVVVQIQAALGRLQPSDDPPPTPRVPYQDKNEINSLSEEYANEFKKRFLKYTAEIERFLCEPENTAILESYNTAVEEFQLKIFAKYSSYKSFDDLLNYLFDMLFKRDVDLNRNKRLTRAMVFYMYWICDIGKNSDA